MKCWSSKPVIVLLLIIQLSSLVVVDDHHLEDVFGQPNAQKTLTNHAWGAKELQKDIPHYCLACLRQANAGISFPVFQPPSLAQSPSITRIVCVGTFRKFDIYISASKRGPPPSLS